MAALQREECRVDVSWSLVDDMTTTQEQEHSLWLWLWHEWETPVTFLDAKSPQDPGSIPWPEGLGMLNFPSEYSLPLHSPLLNNIGIFVPSNINGQMRSITELFVSHYICLLVDWPLMRETNIFHVGSVGEVIFHLCHTLFFIGQGDSLRIAPHPLTSFHVKVKGKTPSWKATCSFFKFFYKFIYLFLAASGFRCCAQVFSSCG